MGEIVNLNQYRKRRERAERGRKASENRVRFGLDATERGRNASDRQARDKALDGKKLDRPADDTDPPKT
jgi:hypothetical protein